MAKILSGSVAIGLLAILAGAACGVKEGIDFSDDLPDIKPENAAPKFAEDTVGLDLHNDFFYYSDDKVNNAYKRGDYLSIKRTSSDPAAKNPFAVAQSASTPVGSLMDRWDYKQSETGYQFFGLYHGVGRPFVVNKLRAQLLRRVANEVQDFLPFLDQTIDDPEFKKNQLYQDDVRQSVSHIIKTVYNEVDKSICGSMKDNDDSYATATVVIVTKNFVVVVNSGDSRVLGYDSTSILRDLTSEARIIGGPLVDGQKKEFGANKSKSKGLAEPDIAFFERNFQDVDGDDAKIQFLTVQSGPAASSVSDEQTKKIVISQVDRYKYRPEYEQELHSDIVINLLRASASQTGLKRWVMNTDFSAIFIALETNYKAIH